jgi:hypothetical protein
MRTADHMQTGPDGIGKTALHETAGTVVAGCSPHTEQTKEGTMMGNWKRTFGLMMVIALGAMVNLPFSTAVSADEVRPAYVRDVDNGAWQPFSACAYDSDTYHKIFNDILVVPAGKRAVIEYVSFLSENDKPIRYVFVEIYDTVAGQPVGKHYLAVTRHGSASGRDNYMGSSPVKLYADPGQIVKFQAFQEPNYTLAFFGEMCISGHYVDITP